jgi:hypothetical protein
MGGICAAHANISDTRYTIQPMLAFCVPIAELSLR